MFKNIDSFGKNIAIVFAGTAFLSFLNLTCQLLIAHRLAAADFAAFNSLLALYMVITSVFIPLQATVTKYISEFNARGEKEKIGIFFSRIFKKLSLAGIFIFIISYFIFSAAMAKLKIVAPFSDYLLAALLALSGISPVLSGAVQGLELFGWYSAISVATGLLKLALVFGFIFLGFGISGVFGAILVTVVIALLLLCVPVRQYFFNRGNRSPVDFKEPFFYLFPVAATSVCFMLLVSCDLIMVKFYFSAEDAGAYSLAQMVGKILLFLPAAISIVMFPRTSGLHAKNLDTVPTLKRSLLYAAGLCAAAALFYNLWPVLSLKILTGKVSGESLLLGRMFSFSMSFFALSWIIFSYFLSKNDLRYLPWLIAFTILQIGSIVMFHQNLFQVQLVLCASAFLLFCLLYWLYSHAAYVKNERY